MTTTHVGKTRNVGIPHRRERRALGRIPIGVPLVAALDATCRIINRRSGPACAVHERTARPWPRAVTA
jgi:hypothetical protein